MTEVVNGNCCQPGQNAGNPCCSPPPARFEASGLRARWKTPASYLALAALAAAVTYSVTTFETSESAYAAIDEEAQVVFISTLEEAFRGTQDVVLVIIPGQDGKFDIMGINDAASTASKIRQTDGITVGLYAVAASSSSENPAVLVAGRNSTTGAYGNRYRVSGEITETRIIQAYLAAWPGSALACCP